MRLRNLIHRIADAGARLFTSLLPRTAAQGLADRALRARHRLMTRVRHCRSRELGDASLEAIQTADGRRLQRIIAERRPPWGQTEPPKCSIPGMLTREEQQYYGYVTQFYSGQGAVVELGTWLGRSTFYLVQGLARNPRFQGPLHCFDDYVWRGSMTKWLKGTSLAAPGDGASFEPLFRQMTEQAGLADKIVARRATFIAGAATADVPPFAWNGPAIELCIVDCGRTLAVNNGWWNVLQPHFIPGRTLIVMQDWLTFKMVPYQFWNQTKIFTDDKLGDLDLVQELDAGGCGTFVYRGPGGDWAAEFTV